jgi:hypothetical protein
VGGQPILVPGAATTLVTGLNNRGQIVGSYETTAAAAGPQPAAMVPGPA